MAQATAHHGDHEPTTTGLNHRKMLMWAFLGSDCMFFGSLIATYLVYKNRSIAGPLPADVFDIPVTTVSTFVLLMSSMSMVLAYAALTRNSMKAFRIWLASTCMLGATFIAFQVYEFYTFVNYEHKVYCAEVGDISELTPVKQELAKKCGTEAEHDGVVEEVVGLTPKTNLFGSTFYTLTGFHGAHVTLGIVWLLSLFFLSFKKGMVTPERNLDLDLAALYWHFVDVVWIVIFTVIYLFGVFPGF